ncbi:family 16 glycosylhydrolase [Winogradskyella alexanderae]|uniref:Family 16 glycosylhydrolase n=1 Tax=Winogradskyella alexanderae TaxID=2877123 RepID=A0ABS7XP86_9FLAO|nr:family 16 glycosylhydrolase [Winogradskyella alexanderae]MCA0131824.1 family 16 glycosylhydrolase [Winogradskyella alexanderae]
MNYILRIAVSFFGFFMFSYGQQTPINFSDSQDAFTTFAGSSFAFNVDPTNANNDVGQFNNDGSDPWQGFFIDLSQPINLSENQLLTLSFYQYDTNSHNILMKLENGTGPDVEVWQSSAGSGWDYDIEFDFSNATVSGVGTPVNAVGTYSRLVIFIDGSANISGTYLIDDVNNGAEESNPHELDVIYSDLVWSDEFDSTSLEAIDNTKWYHQTVGPNGGRWFNDEEQHYTDRLDNSFIEDGHLNIVAKAESYNQDGITLNYTSARLNSKFAFTYGRVDVRAKLPEGDGTWPAIWTLGKNINESGAYWQTQGFGTTSWPACGELDIMEHGLGETNHVSSAIHTPSSFGATENFQSYILNDVANNFHVYSMNWSPDQITFLIDGVGFYTYNPSVKDANTWPFDEDQYLILNIAMGGASGGIASNFVESSMVIDYVRVYQNIGLSIDENFASKFSVYPNPASNYISIVSVENVDSVFLYNTLGQLVLEGSNDVRGFSIKSLNSGIYILKLNSGNRTVTKKLLIH